ncbi:T9SS type A sorting domain-containing protein [Polaribacter haliotis]|uniref:T9SS type A sorting domain-containing protein n=1 Tax=Polaribacter haliotis TaxID=1888915 RepID=A0A7L8AE09_9FLAO|nr:T9SS type A sorting domain-containing protein [Polaribacter haliotis]QOD60238.1 T9SS type A sorting domain-containing protein [Polaribacter haliotis]
MIKSITKLFLVFTLFAFVEPVTEGMYFDGVNDYIIIPNTTNINSTTTNNRTYETYFKTVDPSGGKQIIMKEGGGTRAVIVYIENGFLVMGAYNRTDYTPTWQGTFYRTPITADTWYHFALIFDNAQPGDATTNPMTVGANNALKFYLDGTLVANLSGYQLGGHNSFRLGYKNETLRFPNCATWTATGPASVEYCFGSVANDTGGNEYYFNGNLWGFRIWNDVRTETEINDNMEIIITTLGTDSLVAALDGDTFNYLNSSNNPQEKVNPNNDIITWSATATTTNWNTGSNWVGGSVPTEHQDAIIPSSTNYPLITSHVIVGDVTIETSAEINVSSSGTFDVKYDLENNGTLTVNDNGSLLIRKSDEVVGTGDYNIQKNSPTYTGAYFYSYWSSPTINTNPGTTFPSNPVVYYFNSAVNNSDWAYNTGNFTPGIGYAIRHESAGGYSTTFTGKPNTGNVVVNVYDTTNLEGEGSDEIAWSTSGDNLVGNPYASAIDWGLVATDLDNANIEGTIYLWNQASAEVGENNVGDYVAYNGTGGSTPGIDGKIASGQGFFVKTNGNGTLTFRPTHQIVSNNSQFFKSSKKVVDPKKQGRSWFKLKRGNLTNTILVGFLKEATNRYDRLYDATFDSSQQSLGFYSVVRGDIKASIQGFPELKRAKKVVKIGFIVDELGDYTIELQQEFINEDYYIYLRDTELKKTIDLRKNAYNFTVDTVGENNTRFKIIYTKKKRKESKGLSKSNGVEEIDSKDFSVYVDEAKELIVEYDFDVDKVNEVIVFDIQGRKVANFTKNQQKIISNLSEGVYIVKAFLENKKIKSKKIVIAN